MPCKKFVCQLYIIFVIFNLLNRYNQLYPIWFKLKIHRHAFARWKNEHIILLLLFIIIHYYHSFHHCPRGLRHRNEKIYMNDKSIKYEMQKKPAWHLKKYEKKEDMKEKYNIITNVREWIFKWIYISTWGKKTKNSKLLHSSLIKLGLAT